MTDRKRPRPKPRKRILPKVDRTPTLRDQFAMVALPAFIGNSDADDDAGIAAVMAYKYADAMMEERQWPPIKEDE